MTESCVYPCGKPFQQRNFKQNINSGKAFPFVLITYWIELLALVLHLEHRQNSNYENKLWEVHVIKRRELSFACL